MPSPSHTSPAMTVFATIYLALLAWLAGMTAGIFAQSAWFTISGVELAENDPIPAGAFITFAVTSQITFIAAAVAIVCFLPTGSQANTPDRITRGLRLRPPAIKAWLWPLLLGGNLFVWIATQQIFVWLFTEQGEHLEELGNQIQSVESPAVAALTLIAVGLLPGLGEEAIYRGFVLKRLAGVVPPGLAVLLASLLFAASHVNLQQAALIFPLGLWWTVISWRAGSVWPAVALHTLNNSLTLFIAWGLGETLSELSSTVIYTIIALAVVCFLASAVALCGPGLKLRPEPQSTDTLPETP